MCSAATHWWSHNHISTPTYKAMLKNCDFATFGPISALSPSFRDTLAAPSAGSSPQDACDAACAAAMDESACCFLSARATREHLSPLFCFLN